MSEHAVLLEPVVRGVLQVIPLETVATLAACAPVFAYCWASEEDELVKEKLRLHPAVARQIGSLIGSHDGKSLGQWYFTADRLAQQMETLNTREPYLIASARLKDDSVFGACKRAVLTAQDERWSGTPGVARWMEVVDVVDKFNFTEESLQCAWPEIVDEDPYTIRWQLQLAHWLQSLSSVDVVDSVRKCKAEVEAFAKQLEEDPPLGEYHLRCERLQEKHLRRVLRRL
eukprot:TRINITY_DN23568_c0_g1_i1.p1 TRINITY_DN23568_c0_g1~~TRINITY_DN23568_c0_g1_i1.p1  ORF type:complete len:229 (+),score=44.00 TRINITY_DN23568_c0_g1_i1:65-751(+)